MGVNAVLPTIGGKIGGNPQEDFPFSHLLSDRVEDEATNSVSCEESKNGSKFFYLGGAAL